MGDQDTLILHFAELSVGPNASGIGGAGSRFFRVLWNGNALLHNFDIYKEAGSLKRLVLPMVDLITQRRMACDELIGVTGRAAI